MGLVRVLLEFTFEQALGAADSGWTYNSGALLSRFVAPLSAMPRPLGIESKISAKVQFENIEFALNGRYNRLAHLDGNLELIDYKTTKNAATPDSVDVQLGLYSIALEQVYRHSLKRLSLIFTKGGRDVDVRGE
jgi:putative RecB family exonuclease